MRLKHHFKSIAQGDNTSYVVGGYDRFDLDSIYTYKVQRQELATYAKLVKMRQIFTTCHNGSAYAFIEGRPRLPLWKRHHR